jgi:hypothetical protein
MLNFSSPINAERCNWHDYRYGLSYPSLHARRLAADSGALVGEEVIVAEFRADLAYGDLTVSDGGDILLVWGDTSRLSEKSKQEELDAD